jgi:phosphonate transport system ATP-binding protein
MDVDELLTIARVTLRFPNGREVLRGIDLRVAAGEFVVILGSNGCGKSTLLKSIVRLLTPASGSIRVGGEEFSTLSGRALQAARRAVGMVSQQANLVRRRSVVANVCSGALGRHSDLRTQLGFVPPTELPNAYRLLELVGLADRAEQRAGTLSGGQAQRVSIARALAQRPRVLLADEPIASLDPEASEDILALLRRLAKEEGLAVLCVLHQPQLARKYADRLVGLRDGIVAFDDAPGRVHEAQVAALYGLGVAA